MFIRIMVKAGRRANSLTMLLIKPDANCDEENVELLFNMLLDVARWLVLWFSSLASESRKHIGRDGVSNE